MTAKRSILVCLGLITIFSLIGPMFTSVKADGGGFPTATRTVTPTPTKQSTQAPTATFTSLPTLTPGNPSNQSQPVQEVVSTPVPVAPQTSGGGSGGFTPGCWPIAILILLALILLGTYFVSRRLRGSAPEQ